MVLNMPVCKQNIDMIRKPLVKRSAQAVETIFIEG
jgi:hypothetical protein